MLYFLEIVFISKLLGLSEQVTLHHRHEYFCLFCMHWASSRNNSEVAIVVNFCFLNGHSMSQQFKFFASNIHANKFQSTYEFDFVCTI